MESAPITLVTLNHAGSAWKLSSRPVSVQDADGLDHLYRGGLSPMDLYAEGELSGVSEPQSQTFEAVIDTDIARLVSEFHLTDEATAEVSQIEAGQTLEERRIWLSGSVSIESDGFEGKPLRLKVSADDPATEPTVYPRPDARMDEDTWGLVGTQRRQAEDKAPYPRIFGQAGTITIQGATASVTACPVLPVTISTLTNQFLVYSPWGDIRTTGGGWWTYPASTALLAYGLISEGWVYPGEVGHAQRGQVQGFYRASGVKAWTLVTCDLVYARDGLGRIVTMVDGLVQASAGVPLDNYEYAVAISSPCSGGANSTFSGGLSGAGQIVRWVLERSAVTVDWRRTSSALATLDRYELAGYWDQPCDPWSWLCDNVFPLLPCSWVSGPQGVYPVLWRLDATAYDADAVLTDGLDCTIDGPIKYEGEPLSAHILDFGGSIFGNGYRRRATWHGKRDRATARGSMSLHLTRAQLRYGKQRGGEYLQQEQIAESDMVYADRTADRSLAWQARAYSQPARVLRVVSDGLHHRERVARLEPGMAVSLNSSRYSIENRVAHVRRAGWLGGVCYADLVILSEP
jgi:hypothetical protein